MKFPLRLAAHRLPSAVFLFHTGMIEHHGLYLNLETMKVNPIAV